MGATSPFPFGQGAGVQATLCVRIGGPPFLWVVSLWFHFRYPQKTQTDVAPIPSAAPCGSTASPSPDSRSRSPASRLRNHPENRRTVVCQREGWVGFSGEGGSRTKRRRARFHRPIWEANVRGMATTSQAADLHPNGGPTKGGEGGM